MHKLGIIGCGMSGAVTAMLLKQKFPKLSVIILEKSKGTGGRMCTSRSTYGSTVDLGAQFITRSSKLSSTQEKCYNDLINAGLLSPLSKNVEGLRTKEATNYMFSCGSGSTVKFFTKQSNCEILFKQKVNELCVSNGKVIASCDNGSTHEFDAVILTIPVPQVLQLQGITSLLDGQQLQMLNEVQYTSRYAVGYYYKEDFDFFKNNELDVKFLSDDVIKYCSFAAYKQKNDSNLPSVVFHTSKEFGHQYIDENASIVQNLITSRINELFPELPAPTEVKFHKWRYSQVEKPYEGEVGCIVLSKSPSLLCGGDGFTHSNFEGCILSAEKIIENIT